MSKLPPLRAVTFDLGGTLVEYEHLPWEELETAAWRGLHAHLVDTGYASASADDFSTAMMEISGRYWQRAEATYQSATLGEVFREGLTRLGIAGPNPEDFAELSGHFHAATIDLVSVYDDSAMVLGELKRRGVKLAIISNTLWPGELHTHDLQRFGLDAFFDTMTYSSERPHTKPHPDIFLETLERLGGISPHSAAHVGDRIVDDVRGAQDAGMRGILKAHPRRLPVEGIVPDARIERLAELPAALDRLFAPSGR